MLGAAGAAALMAAGALTAFAVLVLAIFLPAWLAALLVAAVAGRSGLSARRSVARSKSGRPALRSLNKQSKQ